MEEETNTTRTPFGIRPPAEAHNHGVGSDIISRLPLEVLYELVEYVVGDSKGRVSFMNVSKRWRSVVANSPKLWTTIYLLPRKNYVTYTPHMSKFERIDWLVERAGQLLLEVYFNRDKAVDEELQRYFVARAPSERWRTLSITDSSICNAHVLSHCVFPSLRRLLISSHLPSELMSQISKTAPEISKVTVFTDDQALITPIVSVVELIGPETQLRIFPRIIQRDILDTRALLHTRHLLISLLDCNKFSMYTLNNLVSLHIVHTKGEECELSFPNLRSLTLGWDSNHLLRYIKAPLLEELFIDDAEEAILSNIIIDAKDSLPIRRLTLTFESQLSPATLSRLLSLSPRLKELSLFVDLLESYMEMLVGVLLEKGQDHMDGSEKPWNCCHSLSLLKVSVFSPRPIADTVILEGPAKRLFRERSNTLKRIEVDWTCESRWLLE